MTGCTTFVGVSDLPVDVRRYKLLQCLEALRFSISLLQLDAIVEEAMAKFIMLDLVEIDEVSSPLELRLVVCLTSSFKVDFLLRRSAVRSANLRLRSLVFCRIMTMLPDMVMANSLALLGCWCLVIPNCQRLHFVRGENDFASCFVKSVILPARSHDRLRECCNDTMSRVESISIL